MYQVAGLTIKPTCTTEGISMPTCFTSNSTNGTHVPASEEVGLAVEEVRIQCKTLYHSHGEFNGEYGEMSIDNMMENFVRIMPNIAHAYQERRTGVPLELR